MHNKTNNIHNNKKECNPIISKLPSSMILQEPNNRRGNRKSNINHSKSDTKG